MNKKLSLLYFVLAIVHIFLLAFFRDAQGLSAITKIVMMPLLMAIVFKADIKEKFKSLKMILIAALFFSFMGDVFLLDILNRDGLFIFGLSSFLIAHLIYIFLFTRGLKSEALSLKPGKLILAIIILIWAIMITQALSPGLGSLRLPVLIYISVITLMTISAIFRMDRVSSMSFILVFTGAVFFIISDMFIAVNKFISPVEMSRVIVMSTYLAAQYAIVSGLLMHYSRNNIPDADPGT